MAVRVEEEAGPSLLGRLGRLVGEVIGCLGYRLTQYGGGRADWAGGDCVGEAVQPGVGVVGGEGSRSEGREARGRRRGFVCK